MDNGWGAAGVVILIAILITNIVSCVQQIPPARAVMNMSHQLGTLKQKHSDCTIVNL